MALVRQSFSPLAAVLPASAFPQFRTVAGTNFPVPSLAFDAAADEGCYFLFPVPDYGSGNVVVRLKWYSDVATSGAVRWEAALAAITPNTDGQDIETKAFATAAEFGDAHLGTSGQRLHEAEVIVSALDSLAAGDFAVLRVRRLGTAGTDTMTGDAQLVGVEVEYSDV